MNLDQLKVGDKVAVSPRFGDVYAVYTITGETRTRWKAGNCEWRKSDGRLHGGGDWDHRRIEVLTPQLAEQIDRRKWATRIIHDANVRNMAKLLSVAELKAIHAAITGEKLNEGASEQFKDGTK